MAHYVRLLCLTPLPRCKHRARSQTHHSQGCTPPTIPLQRQTIQVLCRLTLTCGWLSRYDRGLLLGLCPALLFIRYRLYFARKIRIQVAQLKRLSTEGRFFCCVCLQWVVRCTTVVRCEWSADASIATIHTHAATPLLPLQT